MSVFLAVGGPVVRQTVFGDWLLDDGSLVPQRAIDRRAAFAEAAARTPSPAAGPHRVGGDAPGSSLIPPECGDPGAPPHLLGKAGHRKARRGDARSGMAGSTAT